MLQLLLLVSFSERLLVLLLVCLLALPLVDLLLLLVAVFFAELVGLCCSGCAAGPVEHSAVVVFVKLAALKRLDLAELCVAVDDLFLFVLVKQIFLELAQLQVLLVRCHVLLDFVEVSVWHQSEYFV